jgi:hypothetical protein
MSVRADEGRATQFFVAECLGESRGDPRLKPLSSRESDRGRDTAPSGKQRSNQ